MRNFAIQRDKSIPDNIRRILSGQMDYIISQCSDEQPDRHKSIHEIRKSCKKLRAVLRLIRDELGYSSYYRENIVFRDLSRKLSAVRNYEVLIDTLQDIKQRIPRNHRRAFVRDIEHSLVNLRERNFKRLVGKENIFRLAEETVQNTKERIAGLPLESDQFSAISSGIRRVYKKGRRAFAVAQEEPSPENLHEFRKKVKYLWYQVQIIGEYANDLEQLSENLGVLHDRSELERYIMGLPLYKLGKRNRNILVERIERNNKLLLMKTWPLARIIYSDEPKVFTGRCIRPLKI